MKYLLLFFLLFTGNSALALTDSRQIFEQHEHKVFQIRVINNDTGKKTTIGSGFLVARQGIIATNFHVVSHFVENPGRYHLEAIDNTGIQKPLTLIDVDVVHDLALLKGHNLSGNAIEFAPLPQKGERLFAMGNPHDLGLSIEVGTNGGLLSQTDDSQILFSGNLNPGMSGGPTFDQFGKLVGINVATSRNGISFIVPATYLQKLVASAEQRNFNSLQNVDYAIGEQLAQKQKAYLETIILGAPWQSARIRALHLPEAISPTIKCWDDSPELEPEQLFRRLNIRCNNKNTIFLNDRIKVGKIGYEYLWVESDQLNPLTFSQLYTSMNTSQVSGFETQQDVSLYQCMGKFVSISGQPFKTTLCRRDYVKHPQLSDLMFTAALVGQPGRGFILNIDFVGTDFKTALNLIEHMLKAIKWQQ